MEFKEFEYTTQGVRVISKEDSVWFVGVDVAKILGYKRPQKAIADHVDVDDKWRLTKETQSQFGIELGQRGGWLINEYGVHDLILTSEMPEAKKFKRWVTHEVLPSIRKTGSYIDTENKFKKNCPITFDRSQCITLMRQVIHAQGSDKTNDNRAWAEMYIGFSNEIGCNVHAKARRAGMTKIEWLEKNDLMKDFCEYIKRQGGAVDDVGRDEL